MRLFLSPNEGSRVFSENFKYHPHLGIVLAHIFSESDATLFATRNEIHAK